MAPEVLRCPFKSKPDENKEKSELHYSNRVDGWAVGEWRAGAGLVSCPAQLPAQHGCWKLCACCQCACWAA